MASDRPGAAGDAGGPEDLCDRCGVPLPEPRREYCNLGAGCCQDCMAGCEKAGRCDKIRDPALWEKIEHLWRMIHDRTYPGGHEKEKR